MPVDRAELKPTTRSRAIRVWFAAVALIVAATFAFGVEMTVGTGLMLLALCLVPPAMILRLWPRGERPTIAEVRRDAERRW